MWGTVKIIICLHPAEYFHDGDSSTTSLLGKKNSIDQHQNTYAGLSGDQSLVSVLVYAGF